MKRDLVVDDDEDVRLVVTHALSTSGFEVKTASDGHQALASAAASVPDVIVLDVMMPEMNGVDAISRIRNGLPEHREIPIVMLTALSDEQTIEDCFRAGASSYMVKPFKVDELIEEVRRLSGE